MPIAKYFLFIGSVLFSLLFLVDSYMPRLPAQPDHSDVDRSIIRIRSAHRWPEAVAIDTSLKPVDPSSRDHIPPSTVGSNHAEAMSQNETGVLAYWPATPDHGRRSPKLPSLKATRVGPRLAWSKHSSDRLIARDPSPPGRLFTSVW
jgi:hypothetical protein